MTDPAASTSAAAATPALGPSAPAIATHGRRRSLAWRLGLLLGVSVVVVLLLVGVVVNRVVSSGFQTVLTEQQQQRLDDAAVTLADRLARPTGLVRAQAVVTRLATSLGGQVEVVSTAGTTLAAYGRQPTGDPAHYEVPIEVDGQVVATLQADVPARAGDRGFLPLFNATLALAGLISVVAIVVISASIAGRLTRPLHDVADRGPAPRGRRVGRASDRRRRPRVRPAGRGVQRHGGPPGTLRDAAPARGQRHRPRPRHAGDRPRIAAPGDDRRCRADRPGRPRGGPVSRRGAGRGRGRHRRSRPRRSRAAPVEAGARWT